MKNDKNKIIGIGLIASAVLLLIFYSGAVSYSFFDYVFSFLLIMLGIYYIFEKELLFASYAFGGSLYLYPGRLPFNLNHLGLFSTFLISSLFGLGFTFLLREQEEIMQEDLTGQAIKIKSYFNESRRSLYGEEINQVEVSAFASSSYVDFSKVSLNQDINIRVNVHIGTIHLYLPYGWRVLNSSSEFFGTTKEHANVADTFYAVYISGNINFGNLVIHYI